MEIKTILVATDLSQASERALDSAVSLAVRFESRLVLFHVCDDTWVDLGLNGSEDKQMTRVLESCLERARGKLQEWAGRAQRSEFEVVTEAAIGTPHLEIVNTAFRVGADLVVLGAQGSGSISPAIMGSTSERVIQRAHCPVMVVREIRS